MPTLVLSLSLADSTDSSIQIKMKNFLIALR